MWSVFDEGVFDNTYQTQLTFFTNSFIRTEQDGGDDEVNYQHEKTNMKTLNAVLGKNMILIDNQSTCNVFYAGHLLRDIRKVNHSHTINSNTGSTKTAWMGDLPGFGPVFFHKNDIANILSLSKVKKRYRVTYDSNGSNAFEVHKRDGEIRSFLDSDKGIYYMDITEEL